METWRFKAKAVVKYNPKNYNADGVYMQPDEWTAYSDIGKKIDSITDTILSRERYLEVERNYINSVKMFIAATNTEKVKVFELYKISDAEDFERYNDNALYQFYTELEEKEYNASEVDTIIQLALRGYVQVALQLISPKMDAAVYFGDDYYMYFVSDTVDFDNLKNKLSQYQMFVN